VYLTNGYGDFQRVLPLILKSGEAVLRTTNIRSAMCRARLLPHGFSKETFTARNLRREGATRVSAPEMANLLSSRAATLVERFW
jgi:hypothetical protein